MFSLSAQCWGAASGAVVGEHAQTWPLACFLVKGPSYLSRVCILLAPQKRGTAFQAVRAVCEPNAATAGPELLFGDKLEAGLNKGHPPLNFFGEAGSIVHHGKQNKNSSSVSTEHSVVDGIS